MDKRQTEHEMMVLKEPGEQYSDATHTLLYQGLSKIPDVTPKCFLNRLEL
jgi:hypothetical protein